MTLLRSKLPWVLRNHRILTRHFKRHIQEFPIDKTDNTAPYDHLVILPEPLNEKSNPLLDLSSSDSSVIDFANISAESAFRGLSQALCQYENLLTDINNETVTFSNFQELIEELENKDVPLSTAYNSLFMLCNLDSEKFEFKEIYDLLRRVKETKNEKFWDSMKQSIKPYYNDIDSKHLSNPQKKLITYYKLLNPYSNVMQPAEQSSLLAYKKFLRRDSMAVRSNLYSANQLFSHTVDDPDVLACISEDFDECIGLHHKNRTPLKVTADTYERFMEVCPDRFIRHNLWKTWNKRCSPKAAPHLNNLHIIANLRTLRRSSANLLGYRNHLDYRLSYASAASRQSIVDKLSDLNQENCKLIPDRLMELETFASDNGFSDPLQLGIRDYDVDFWANKYIHDIIIGKGESEVKVYFPLSSVLDGLNNFFKNYIGVDIESSDNSIRAWHDTVKSLRFIKDGQTLGIVLFDPYQRQNKMLTDLTVGVARDRHKRSCLSPIHFIATPYKLNSLTGDALLSVRDVANLFFSFGLALQKMLFNYDIYELNSYGGLEHDAENLLPNLVVLHLLSDHRILQSCSRREDGKPIDSDLTLRLLKAHSYFKCFKTWKELYKAHLDIEAHSTLADIRTIVADIYPKYSPFPRDADNFDYCSMSDIFGGPHDGRKYSYLWSKLLARFCLSKTLSQSGTEELAQIDTAVIRASNQSLIDTIFDPNDFSTKEKLASFVGRQFEASQTSLGVL